MTTAVRPVRSPAPPAPTSSGTGRPARPTTGRMAVSVVSVAVAMAFVLPLFWAFVNSIKSPAEAAAAPPTWLPHALSAGNYRRVGSIGAGGIASALLNSLYATAVTIVLTCTVSACAGYAFARFRFRGTGVLFVLILLTLMVPFQSILIPLYIMFGKLHLTNSMLGLGILYSTFQLPFATFVMRNTFEQIPTVLDDAAFVDGCGTFRLLVQVLLPSAYPGVITVALFSFLFSWNELLAALVMVSDAGRFTVPVMLSLVLANQYGTVVWGALQAGVVIAAAPCVVVFLSLQRYYRAGITAGAVKG